MLQAMREALLLYLPFKKTTVSRSVAFLSSSPPLVFIFDLLGSILDLLGSILGILAVFWRVG